MKHPTHKQRFMATKSIPGVCREDECVILDPGNSSILVGRWVPWSELPQIMKHKDSLRPIALVQA